MIGRKSPAVERNRLRVVHLSARLPIGGMENVVALLLAQLPRAQFRSQAWCLEEADALGTELKAAGESILELHKASRRDTRLFWRIGRLLRRHRVDVLHCHDELSWFYGTIAARLAGRTRVVVTMHGRRRDMSRRHRLEQRLLARATDSVVCVSDFLRQQIIAELGVRENRVTTIKNGVPLPIRLPGEGEREGARALLRVPPGAVVIGSVSELSAVKNLDMSLEAAALALPLVPDLYVVFVGDGAERPRLEQKAAQFGLRHRVVFAGWRRDVRSLLPGFDMYVCSSHYEGISLSILEAMACGRAIIGSAVGGNPELIQDGRTGLLVGPGNSRMLADKIAQLAGDAAMRKRLGREAQQFVGAAHSVERMVSDYAQLYETLRKERPAGATPL